MSQCRGMQSRREQWLVRVSITANQAAVGQESSEGGGFRCFRMKVYHCCHSRIKNDREAAERPGCTEWAPGFLNLHRDVPSAGWVLIIMSQQRSRLWEPVRGWELTIVSQQRSCLCEPVRVWERVIMSQQHSHLWEPVRGWERVITSQQCSGLWEPVRGWELVIMSQQCSRLWNQ